MLLKNPALINTRKFIVNKVRRDSVLWNVLHFLYSLGMPWIPNTSIAKILSFYSKNKKNIFFIEIGANDGITSDLLRSYIIRDRWSGILIEPIKHIFNRLKVNYHGYQNLIFENVAVADKEESRLFYIPRKNGAETRASFSLDVILSDPRLNIKIEEDLIAERVQCVTLEKLLEKHGIVKVDIILIDTEGSDYEIIKHINFNIIKPSLIIFERNNLTFHDYKKCINYLVKNGYRLSKDGNNVLAIKGAHANLFKNI
ncbi:MAG: FkbM family methyltransferase [Candidatus Omnitrophota bacterium]